MSAPNRFWFLVLGAVAAVAAAPGRPMCQVHVQIEGRIVGVDSVWLGMQDRRDPISEESVKWATYFKGRSIDTTLLLPAGRDYQLGGDFVPKGAIRGLLVKISTPMNHEYFTPEKDLSVKVERRSAAFGVDAWFSLTSVCEVD